MGAGERADGTGDHRGRPVRSPQGELVALVERAEGDHAAEAAAYDEWQPEPHHPAEGPPFPAVPALVADTLGLALATVRRIAPWFGLPPEVAGGLDAIRHHPRLRHLVGDVGPNGHADSLLPVVTALVQGVATGGGGLALDVLQRLAVWREASAEGAAWSERETSLVRGPEEASADAVTVLRPGRTPQDAADRYTTRSMAAGLAVGAATLPFAGVRKAIAVAVASVPKAPGAGREGFATSLGRELALRGVVTMDRTALRRLGQVDTILLDEEALRGDRYELMDLELFADTDHAQVSERLFALFDSQRPLSPERTDEWSLGPLDELHLRGRTGGKAVKRLRKRGAEKFLGLARGHRLLAVAGLGTQSAPGSEAVAAAARRAGARVVVASDRERPAPAYADAVVPAGDRLAASVRDLQVDGAVVLLISGNRTALGAADCAIGVHREAEHTPGEHTSWSERTWRQPA